VTVDSAGVRFRTAIDDQVGGDDPFAGIARRQADGDIPRRLGREYDRKGGLVTKLAGGQASSRRDTNVGGGPGKRQVLTAENGAKRVAAGRGQAAVTGKVAGARA